MTLHAGDRLGHYEIVSPLGAGGMGEVYRARDPGLEREVAIKVLPEAVAGDAERLQRFEREARALAALNHPHVATLYGLERDGDTPFLVMELVEGPTLADRIAQGPLPWREAAAIFGQIAEGLEAAHERGIVHRDLKPANVKLGAADSTGPGRVKILDFGLATAMAAGAAGSSGPDPALSPTLTLGATQRGEILGTAGYMSPEQARGGAVDKRADVWAFGVCLMEALTGRPIFDGDTVSDRLASVLKEEPDWSALPADLPLGLRRVLERCLDKAVSERLRDIGEARIRLRRLLGDPEEGAAGEERTIPRAGASLRTLPLWLALLLPIVAAALAFVAGRGLTEPAPSARLSFQEPPPAGTTLVAAPTPSPDGRTLALRAADENSGVVRIWVRPLEVEQARPLEGTEGAEMLIWSPDAESLAFVAGGELRRISIQGGPPRLVSVLTTDPAGGGAWTSEDDLVVVSESEGVVVVPAAGGTPRVLRPRADEQVYYLQQVPGAKRLLWAEFGGREPGLYSGDLELGDPRLLVPGDISLVRAVSPELLLYERDGLIVGQRMREEMRELDGEAFPVEEQVAPELTSNSANRFRNSYRSGGEGTLAILQPASAGTRLTWYDRQGKVVGAEGTDGLYEEVELSSDGETVVYVRVDPADGNRDLWARRLSQPAPERLSLDPDTDHLLALSHDGREVAWESHRGARLSMMRRPVDGSMPESLIRHWERGGGIDDWSPDGSVLLFRSQGGQTRGDLWLVPLDPAVEAVPLLASPFNEMNGSFAPDGSAVAYSSDESGSQQIYVQPLDGMRPLAGRQRISVDDGDFPLWRPDGGELYFLSRGALMASEVTRTADGLSFTTPAPLFPLELPAELRQGGPYAVMPGGQRFLAITPTSVESERTATVIVNWAQGLDAR